MIVPHCLGAATRVRDYARGGFPGGDRTGRQDRDERGILAARGSRGDGGQPKAVVALNSPRSGFGSQRSSSTDIPPSPTPRRRRYLSWSWCTGLPWGRLRFTPPRPAGSFCLLVDEFGAHLEHVADRQGPVARAATNINRDAVLPTGPRAGGFLFLTALTRTSGAMLAGRSRDRSAPLCVA